MNHFTLERGEQSCKGTEQRRLSNPGGASDGDDFASMKREIHATNQRFGFGEPNGEALCTEKDLTHDAPSSRCF